MHLLTEHTHKNLRSLSLKLQLKNFCKGELIELLLNIVMKCKTHHREDYHTWEEMFTVVMDQRWLTVFAGTKIRTTFWTCCLRISQKYIIYKHQSFQQTSSKHCGACGGGIKVESWNGVLTGVQNCMEPAVWNPSWWNILSNCMYLYALEQ